MSARNRVLRGWEYGSRDPSVLDVRLREWAGRHLRLVVDGPVAHHGAEPIRLAAGSCYEAGDSALTALVVAVEQFDGDWASFPQTREEVTTQGILRIAEAHL